MSHLSCCGTLKCAPLFYLQGLIDLLHIVSPVSAKQLNLAAMLWLLNQDTVSELFYVTVHVFSCITDILQRPCFYLLNKINEPEFLFVFQV